MSLMKSFKFRKNQPSVTSSSSSDDENIENTIKTIAKDDKINYKEAKKEYVKFLMFCCPDCDFKTKDVLEFEGHIGYHQCESTPDFDVIQAQMEMDQDTYLLSRN